MNPIRQREMLKEMFRKEVLPSKYLHMFLQSPVFEYTDDKHRFTDEEVAYLLPLLLDSETDVPTYAPFPSFRVYSKAGWIHYSYTAATQEWVIVEAIEQDKDWFWIIQTTRRNETRMSVYMNSKHYPLSDKSKVSEYSLWQKGELFRFLAHLLYPNTTVLRVSPKNVEARSVEWVLAHTHYTIINRKSAQHAAQSKRAITPHDIKRAAHWRAAHFRLLRAERFTHKRGQRVPVHHSWIGPKEWIGLDDKMYKVVDLPTPKGK
jgi:hypothetical protein